MNILVVDDEEIQVETIRRGLRRKKFEVVGALNGQEALTHLNDVNSAIDMVLTDYAMPGMSGLELLRRIREKDGDIPVIIMTAYGDKGLVINAMRNACDSFIEKPFTLEILADEIDRVFVMTARKKRFREFSEAILEFVHQINNPLFAISAGAELSLFDLEKDDTESLKDRIVRILRATERIGEINKKMRDLGKGMRDDLEDLNMDALLDDCLEMFADFLKLNRISVKKSLHAETVRIFGNRFEMEQVFKNLILNAIEAMEDMPKKSLQIGSSLNEISGLLTVYIEDTGCGIPGSALDGVFKPYFTTKKKGTGLGLAFIKRILDKHQGMIDVKSTLAQGTRFNIMLRPNTGERSAKIGCGRGSS